MKLPTSPTRRRFLEFLTSVAAVHVIAITAYYALDLAQTPARQQRFFAWAWIAVTIVVVLVGLQRIKRARRAAARPASLRR